MVDAFMEGYPEFEEDYETALSGRRVCKQVGEFERCGWVKERAGMATFEPARFFANQASHDLPRKRMAPIVSEPPHCPTGGDQ